MPDWRWAPLQPAVHILGWHLVGPLQATFQVFDVHPPIPFVIIRNRDCIRAEPGQLEIIRFGLDLVSPTLPIWFSIGTRKAGPGSAAAGGSDDAAAAAATPIVVRGAEVGSQRWEEWKRSLDLRAKVANKWDKGRHATAYDSAR